MEVIEMLDVISNQLERANRLKYAELVLHSIEVMANPSISEEDKQYVEAILNRLEPKR